MWRSIADAPGIRERLVRGKEIVDPDDNEGANDDMSNAQSWHCYHELTCRGTAETPESMPIEMLDTIASRDEKREASAGRWNA